MAIAFAGAAEEFDIELTVEANGNKPISPLSVAAELPCVSENELQLGRRSSISNRLNDSSRAWPKRLAMFGECE
jgi:hypothetical protein